MPRALLVSLMLSFTAPVLAADPGCAQLGPDAASAALTQAFEAYAGLDPEGFASALADAERAVACVGGSLDDDDQSQLWLARGLDGWLRRDKAALMAAFAELVALDPRVAPGPEIVPPGSALENALMAEKRRQVKAAVIPEPIVEPEPVPVVAAVGPSVEQAVEGPLTTRRTSWGLLGGGLAVGAVAGASAIVSQRAGDRFWAAEARSDAQSAYDLNRSAGFTAYGAAGVSAGLVLGAVVVGRW